MRYPASEKLEIIRAVETSLGLACRRCRIALHDEALPVLDQCVAH